jgi:hypothetical protein
MATLWSLASIVCKFNFRKAEVIEREETGVQLT